MTRAMVGLVVAAGIAVLAACGYYAYTVVASPSAQSMSAGAATWIATYQDVVLGLATKYASGTLATNTAYLLSNPGGGALASQWTAPRNAYAALSSADQATVAAVLSSLGLVLA